LDNLTHSLVGALLGRAGLKRLTPLAMPALIVSANLPDIDGWVAPLFGVPGLVAHRGFTHGIGGLVTLPFLTAAIIYLWQRLRPSKEGRVRLGGLLILGFIGVLSHDFLDYLTGYGTRLLEPLSHRWFYGDTLFIVDPWVWLMLILGLELSWRAERLGRDWRVPALTAFSVFAGYVAINFAISERAVAATRPLVEQVAQPRLVVASEVRLTFWKRQMVWRGDLIGGSGSYDPFAGARLDPVIVPLRLDDPRLAAAEKRDPHVRAFLFWSRMPMVFEAADRAFLTDQRFYGQTRSVRTASYFVIPLDSASAAQ
jgi:inner membrane protein